MNEFETYLEKLADHEKKKCKALMSSRERILVYAGIRLNWLGDLLANPDIRYDKKDVPVNKVLFTGTNPEWNKVLIDACEKSVEKFQMLIEANEEMRNKFAREASFGNEPILLRSPNEKGLYPVSDGMHRVVGAVIEKRKTVTAYVPIDEDKHLPVCEAHTVYDVIRGFQRNARDEEGKIQLYHALKLLARTYKNVPGLLATRFNSTYVHDEDVQEIIQKVCNESR
jgi:hypothetical protein